MINVSKKDMVCAVAKKTGNSQETVHEIVTDLFEEIIKHYHAGNTVELRGFGTFYSYHKKARIYVIPRLKEKRKAKGRLSLKFRPSKQIILHKD